MREKRKILWSLWERLQQIRECDEQGRIKCSFCGGSFGYIEMNLIVMFKQYGFVYWFLRENNYFCCDNCNKKENHIVRRAENKELSQNMSRVPMTYNEGDLIEAIQKLARKIKNHDAL